jgi:hypothetical protein
VFPHVALAEVLAEVFTQVRAWVVDDREWEIMVYGDLGRWIDGWRG